MQDRLADEEGGEGDHRAEHEDERGEDHALAASMGSRRGTASRLARIIPVEYSEAITMTPEDADGELAEKKPLPRICSWGRR